MPFREDVIARARKPLYAGFNRLIELVLDIPRHDGGRLELSREVLLRHDAATAIVHDIDRDVFVFVEQFRAAVYETGADGWLLELVAGKIDDGDDAESCIRREIEEEAGYRVTALEFIGRYYPASGVCAEVMHMFYAPVRGADLVSPDTTGADHDEDLRRVELSRSAFLDKLGRMDFLDGKALAVSGWALRRFGPVESR